MAVLSEFYLSLRAPPQWLRTSRMIMNITANWKSFQNIHAAYIPRRASCYYSRYLSSRNPDGDKNFYRTHYRV
jgi:hypothetical protein